MSALLAKFVVLKCIQVLVKESSLHTRTSEATVWWRSGRWSPTLVPSGFWRNLFVDREEKNRMKRQKRWIHFWAVDMCDISEIVYTITWGELPRVYDSIWMFRIMTRINNVANKISHYNDMNHMQSLLHLWNWWKVHYILKSKRKHRV